MGFNAALLQLLLSMSHLFYGFGAPLSVARLVSSDGTLLYIRGLLMFWHILNSCPRCSMCSRFGAAKGWSGLLDTHSPTTQQ